MSTRKECILCNNINFSKSLFNFEKFHLFLRNTRQVCDSSKKVLVIKTHTQSVTLHNPIPWHASIYSFFSLNIFQTTRYQQKYYTFEDPISLWKSENVDVANPVDKVEYQKNQWKHLPAKEVFLSSKDRSRIVHCCTIFHLRSGLWNIVQGGEAIYGVADCKWGHRGKSWPNWVPFFSKTPLTQCSGWPKKISPKISTQIST